MNIHFMKYGILLFCCMASISFASPLSDLWTKVLTLEQKGEYKQTTELIQSYLDQAGKKTSKIERQKLEFEIDRLERVRQDYSMTESGLLQAIQKDIPDFTAIEFAQLESKGAFDIKTIDGEKFYLGSSKSNLYFRYPEYNKRRENGNKPDNEALTHWKDYEIIKAEGEKSKSSFVNPQKYHMTMTITVNKDATPDGKTIRCWIPFPRNAEMQKEIKYISSEPSKHILAPGNAPMRSIYFEKKAKSGEPTVFKVDYEYTAYSRFNVLDPKKIKPYKKGSAEYKKWTQERPGDIFFSADIKELSKKIVGDEKNPCIIAKRLYDWIADNTKYSYAPEYSTLPSQSAYCLKNRYGDCGQHAMLFITLCRYNGIPARWQTGWNLVTQNGGMHDWSEIYLEPYGWVPVDADFGVWTHYWEPTLGKEKCAILHDFYFGSIDNRRLIANGDSGRDLIPSKKSFRSDTVDFQRAELECQGKNIYFNKFDYKMEVKRY